uniref:DUF3291 domain-containing protein n=1 Tax=Skeletonema marinoi TaxID=267567 RepID=A0A7S2M0U2_9STRA|mmetsp:Transcript_33463/g.56639  ORF Transcript_33463/g.56639 Transcript_33463/m.56639 type:complete len:137 (+) Transcript_33463:122-532(+)
MTTDMNLVSITGFVTKDLLSTIKFLYYTSRAVKSAQIAEGNISSTTFKDADIFMTLTVWQDKESMRKFYLGGEHREAMRQTKPLGLYAKVHSYLTDEVPTTEEAIKIWRNDGRIVHGEPDPKYGDEIVSDEDVSTE